MGCGWRWPVLAAFLAGCGPSQVTEQTLPNSTKTAELVRTVTSGGGAAGWINGDWSLRVAGIAGAFPIAGASHAPDFPTEWAGDRTLVLCMPSAWPAEVVLEGVEARTPRGDVKVDIAYRCRPD